MRGYAHTRCTQFSLCHARAKRDLTLCRINLTRRLLGPCRSLLMMPKLLPNNVRRKHPLLLCRIQQTTYNPKPALANEGTNEQRLSRGNRGVRQTESKKCSGRATPLSLAPRRPVRYAGGNNRSGWTAALASAQTHGPFSMR